MRKLIFFISSGIAVLLIVILFFVFQFISSPRNTQPVNNFSLPTPVPLGLKTIPSQSRPNLKYSRQKTDELLNKAKIRQALSPEGEVAKIKLISGLGNTSGRVFVNENITIDYMSSPDLFQGEILSNNISGAKQEAVNFMLSTGFSPSDVCYLPLSFYLNSKISSELKKSNIIFNPLPEGC